MSQWGRRLVWLTRELSLEQGEKKVNHFWKKGQEDQENYKDAVKSCRGKTRRAKAWLELNLATELL